MKRKDASRSELMLKIKEGARIEDVLSGVQGILQSSSSFPETDDPDLACVFKLEVQPLSAAEIKQNLEKSPLVDFVEEPVVRRLIRRTASASKDKDHGDGT